ncbi:MAG: hypothetical protein KC468_23910, partial [Myxococcales bacterium]|nr:hypothetical protein [Myxococcales bacterium]
MNESAALAEDASRLLCFGLRPRVRAAQRPEYGTLLRRFRTEAPLRAHVEAIARGLGLCVLGATEQGIVLGAEDESPFAQRLVDYRRTKNISTQERMCHGLIQLVIAAWCFPTGQSLEIDDEALGTRVSVNEIVDYLIGVCEELKSRAVADPEHGSPELEEAWRGVLSRAAIRSTSDNRNVPKTLVGMTAHALKHLERGGLMRRVDDEGNGAWQPL